MPDSKLLRACGKPVDVGTAPLTQQQAEDMWITDRLRLLDCYRRHLALTKFIIDRDNALMGNAEGKP